MTASRRAGIALVAALVVQAPLACNAAAGVALPPAERIVLENGTVIILNEKRDVPLIGIEAVLKGGAVADPAGQSGLASLFASLIGKGAGERDAAAFAEAIESVGGELGASAGRESISISGNFLARDAALMVELLADMLRNPRLERAEFDKLRGRAINLILAAKDSDPAELMSLYAGGFLFAEHPYGTPVGGSESSLAAISHRDVLQYYEQQVGGDRLIVSVSGDFDSANMKTRLKDAFAGWRAATAEPVEVPVGERLRGRRVLLIDKPGSTQTYFWIGNVGVSRYYDRRVDLDLANTVFGGRFTSMLNTALRVESGLTYGARSTLVRPTKPGSVGISSYTRTASTIEAIDLSLELLDRLRVSGIDAEALASAKNYVLGQFPTSLETATQLAGQFAMLEAYGLARSYIDDYGTAIAAATPESVAATIVDVYPRTDNLVFVLLGDAESIREPVTKYGPVTEMSIAEPRFSEPPETP